MRWGNSKIENYVLENQKYLDFIVDSIVGSKVFICGSLDMLHHFHESHVFICKVEIIIKAIQSYGKSYMKHCVCVCVDI